MVSNDTVIYKRDYKNKYYIIDREWVTIDFSENVDLAFKNFLTRFEEVVDVAFPLYKIKQNSSYIDNKRKNTKHGLVRI